LTLTSARADEPGYYYGGLSVGQARASMDAGQTASSAIGGAPVSGVTSNENDTAYKLFGGYQINRNIGFELGYFDLVGTLPVSDTFSVIGRVGATGGRTQAHLTGPGATGPTDVTENQTNAKLGLGLQWEMSPSFWLRGEVERYRVNNAMGSRNNVDVYTLSLVIPFGRGNVGQTRPYTTGTQR
jgi:OOP family OmpA-OmpF porin